MSQQQILEAFQQHERFIVASHQHLDGDSLGSQLAVAVLLRQLGKTVQPVDSTPVPRAYDFLPLSTEVLLSEQYDEPFDAAVIVDCANFERTATVADLIRKRGAAIINIDHHISNKLFGDVNWVDDQYASVGEMIFGLFEESAQPVPYEAAVNIYTSMVTDTGSFRYSNTSPRTHDIAGQLVRLGVSPQEVYSQIYERLRPSDLELHRQVLDTLTVTEEGRIVYLQLTQAMLKASGSDLTDTDSYLNYGRSIEGVLVALAFREEPATGQIKVSLRSKGGEVDVNEVAQTLNGGGHSRAAGCLLVDTNMEQATARVLEAVIKRLPVTATS